MAYAPRKDPSPRGKTPARTSTKRSDSGKQSVFKATKRTFASSARPYSARSSDAGGKGLFPQKPPYRPATSKLSYPSASRSEHAKKPFMAPKPARTKSASFHVAPATTSWGEVATWYDKHLTEADTYHQKVILPNLLRLIDAKKGESILDLASGQGFFTRPLSEKGATLIGVDISEELIAIAKKTSPTITYHVATAEDLSMIDDASIDKVLFVLAIQNIAHIQKVLEETARVLKTGGIFHIVMNHPSFRIPKRSSWEYDEKRKVQYRRIEEYMSESKTEIAMHPGMERSPQTISFHRPLQYYFKLLSKAGFMVNRLEEWISHKESDSGPRARAENDTRKEIPLFLYLSAIKKDQGAFGNTR